MRDKRILVTGGCGFIGSSFIRYLLRGGEDRRPTFLLNLDALTYAGNPANVVEVANDPAYQFEQCDIGDEDRVFQLLRENRIDAVVNFAAESHVDRSIDSPEPFFLTNVVGTLRLLNAFRRHWMDAGRPTAFRFLHISTDEVHGTLGEDDPAFTETTPFTPNSPYAASKASSDHLVRASHHTYGVPVVTTNCSNNYGPFQFPEKLIPLVILNALEGRPLPIYGDGMQVRDWLYVEDHADAILRVLLGGRVGETYNVGGLNQMSNLDIVRAICGLLDRKLPRGDGKSYAAQIAHVSDRPGHDRRYAIDCGKIHHELGWAPRESFNSGLEKTVAWYLKNKDWAEAITRKKYGRERLGGIKS